MGKWTRLWRYCVPHGARAAVLIILGFALLVAAFTLDVCPAWLKYAAYLLSAYATLALCANVGRWFRYCMAWIEGCAPARHYIHDSDFRNRVSLCWGVCANALYAALQGSACANTALGLDGCALRLLYRTYADALAGISLRSTCARHARRLEALWRGGPAVDTARRLN